MKITVIAPVISQGETRESVREFSAACRPDTQVEVVFLDRGPASIESEYEDVLAAPDTVAKAYQAQQDGADAVLINCMLDPGLEAAREICTIPVVGPAQASLHLAAMLGQRYSVITVVSRLAMPILRLARTYGLSDRLASIRAIDAPVLDVESDQQRFVDATHRECQQAVDHDGAQVLVFGCTGMAGMARSVQEALHRSGYNIPLVEPAIAALKLAETLVDMRLVHSQSTYPFPPEKAVIGFPKLK